MPPRAIAASLPQILNEIARHPEGMGLEALQAALPGPPARRTLQRHLATLVHQQQLVTQGLGRALRYRRPPPLLPGQPLRVAEPDPPMVVPALREDGPVPLSPEGRDIRQQVRQPLTQRRPCTYEIAFLEAYVPNETPYLPEAVRSQLHQMGRSDVQAQAPAGTFARDILGRLLIDLSWASSQLEGNTYSRLDTERLIAHGQSAEGKDAFETQMILNHKAAIEYLVGDARVAVDPATVIALHALLSDGLLRDPQAVGRLRSRPVEIGGSSFLPLALPQSIAELFGIVLQMAGEIVDPFEQAFFLMVHLPYLQPFEDVNKRVSRLAANIPLVRHNLSPLSFIGVATQAYVDAMLGVYELRRVELLRDLFVWAYAQSCQQYVALRQQMVPPDTFRLRYRAELGAAIRHIVQQGLSLQDADIGRVVPALVRQEEQGRFVALVRAEFDALHEGNAIRFGLRPLELAAWRERQARGSG